MATGARYFVPFRRRREGKTDYYRRLKLLLSEKPRMVVRKTNRQIIIQLVTAELTGDRTLVATYSHELTAFGWKGALGNTPAAYLTGMLFATRAREAGYTEAILDIGLARASAGARVFAALKGAVDAGFEIPHGESILPNEERIRGSHIAAYAPERAGNIEKNMEEVAEAIRSGAKIS